MSRLALSKERWFTCACDDWQVKTEDINDDQMAHAAGN
ncbi:hypothetical protein PF008_g9286 [Phytophthora fragariae]|uniref:Uncharacterized protein n=1 Tax=Phytophthora fragariae TaxID=53985 RepID=A0A6G0RX20_9STRA|nr:hypothetical protein PF008_g9286 [Phytophthora fragariae]